MSKSVAVIMCVYFKDDQHLLDLSVESVVNQTYRDISLYIYLDGPLTNELNSVLNKYRFKKNIFIFASEINNGLAYGLNFLIEKALLSNCSYIARMDADDFCLSNRIEAQVSFLESNHHVSVLGTAITEYDGIKNTFNKVLPLNHNDLIRNFIKQCPFNHPTVIFRRSVFEDGMRYPTDKLLSEDIYFWTELAANGYIFANLQSPLLKFYITEDTIKRRRGIKKAYAELGVRFHIMSKLNLFSGMNLLYSIAHFLIRVGPYSLHKLAYKFRARI